MSHLATLREQLRTSLWFIPGLFAVAALIGGLLVVEIDRVLQLDGSAFYLYGGTPEGARSVLSTIAQSMLTFTGLVFTVTMLVLQLASSQLSPRVLRTFLADRQNQVVLGLFVATFIFTLVVLRNVRAESADEAFVPGLSVWIALMLLGGSVAAFIYYINHMAHAIRASTVIANIAEDTRRAIDRTFPAESNRDAERRPIDVDAEAASADDIREWLVVDARDAGSVVALDEEALLKVARDAGALIEVIPRIGDFVPRAAPLMRTSARSLDDKLERRSRAAVTLSRERTMQQDPAFGFRQLVDVAVRALSPGTNDPTTAAQAIDALHDLLLQLADRPIPSRTLRGDDTTGVIVKQAGWDDFVHLAADELRLYGAGHLQVMRQLHHMLTSVSERCPPERRQVLYAQLERLTATIADTPELKAFDVLPRR